MLRSLNWSAFVMQLFKWIFLFSILLPPFEIDLNHNFFQSYMCKGKLLGFFPYHFAFIRTWIEFNSSFRNLKMHIFNYIKLAIYITKRGDRFETFNFALIRLNYIYSKHILQVKILHCHCIYNGSVITFVILKISVTINRISILCEKYSKCCFINMTFIVLIHW